MRFSIRDLCWLTAVVALAATIYGDRIQTSRLRRKWEMEKAQVANETAAALAQMRNRVNAVHLRNVMQEHHFEQQLAVERREHLRELQQVREQAVMQTRLRPLGAATVPAPVD